MLALTTLVHELERRGVGTFGVAIAVTCIAEVEPMCANRLLACTTDIFLRFLSPSPAPPTRHDTPAHPHADVCR